MHTTRDRRILIVGSRPHHARYMKRYRFCAERVFPDAEIRFFAPANALFDNEEAEVERISGLLPLCETELKSRRWDLVIHTIHAWEMEVASGFRLYLGHGIDKGRTLQGPRSPYDTMPIVNSHSPYDLVACKSGQEIERALKLRPDLQGKLVLVGDPMADDLIEGDAHRQAFRAKFGFGPEDTAIGLFSSWGELSCFEKWAELLKSRRDDRSLRFILFLHPNDLLRKNQRRDFRELESSLEDRGVILVPPNEEFYPYMCTCDAAIAGDTAMTLYFSLLLRPLFYCGAYSSSGVSGSPLSEIARFAPRIDPFSLPDLEAVRRLMRDYPIETLRNFRGKILTRPGRGYEDLRRLFRTVEDRADRWMNEPRV